MKLDRKIEAILFFVSVIYLVLFYPGPEVMEQANERLIIIWAIPIMAFLASLFIKIKIRKAIRFMPIDVFLIFMLSLAVRLTLV